MLLKNIHIGVCRSIDDIKGPDYTTIINNTSNATMWRSKVSVLVVDDKAFPFETSLRAKGFRIQYEQDIEPAAACDYDLILCDQYNVGKKLKGEAEGGSLARAIKRRFPLKYVVLYTSQAKMVGFDKGLKMLDDIVFAGMDDDDFEAKMDEWCQICTDPVAQWKRLRHFLLDAGVSVHAVAELESDFVRQYRKTGTFCLPKNHSYCGNGVLNQMVEALLKDFIKVVISKAVVFGVATAAGGV